MDLSDIAPIGLATEALIAAAVGVREYRLKARTPRAEIDIKLASLFAELVPIGYLGREHEALRGPAAVALGALDHVDIQPKLRDARAAALQLLEEPANSGISRVKCENR